jgi:hypothetical protein
MNSEVSEVHLYGRQPSRHPIKALTGSCQVSLSTSQSQTQSADLGSDLLQDSRATSDGPTDTAAAAKPLLTSFGAKSAITEDALEAACAEEELLDFSSESLLLAAILFAAQATKAATLHFLQPSCCCLPVVCNPLGSSMCTGPCNLDNHIITSQAHHVQHSCGNFVGDRILSTPFAANCRVAARSFSTHHAAHVPGHGPGVDLHAAHGPALRGREDLPPSGRLAVEAWQRRLWHCECSINCCS